MLMFGSYQTSHSPMQQLFANQSCDPFSDPDVQCIVGAYIQYAVNVSKAEHVTKTIQFCKKHDIRLVIRNTGHELEVYFITHFITDSR